LFIVPVIFQLLPLKLVALLAGLLAHDTAMTAIIQFIWQKSSASESPGFHLRPSS